MQKVSLRMLKFETEPHRAHPTKLREKANKRDRYCAVHYEIQGVQCRSKNWL